MNNNYKSATTAGLLGIFLGTVGAHDWYLGDRKKGTIHVCLFGAGLAILIIGQAVLPNVLSYWTLYKVLWLIDLLNWAGWLVISASEIWGFIDGIKILSQGDAGLAQRGYAVNPNAGMNPNMGMNNMNGMNMNNNMNGFNQGNNMGQMNNTNGYNNNFQNNMGPMNNMGGFNNQGNQGSNMNGSNNNSNNNSNEGQNSSNGSK